MGFGFEGYAVGLRGSGFGFTIRSSGFRVWRMGFVV